MESDDNRCTPDCDSEDYRERTKGEPGDNPNLVNHCFIATAVYGDIDAPEVEVLRQFRDNVLRESGIGRLAIQLYYSGAGARAADFIREYAPSTIPLIKRGLDYLVHKYQSE